MYSLRFISQRLIPILVSALALLALSWSWLALPVRLSDLSRPSFLFVWLFLVGAGVLAEQFPIHIRSRIKATMGTVPLFLMAVFLPPTLAALTTALVVLVSELRARAARGNLAGDIATATARWALVSLMGSYVAHLPTTNSLEQTLLLVATSLVMFTLDVVTLSLETASMSSEPTWRMMLATCKEGGMLEGVQYLSGILTALATFQQVLALGLIALPTAVVYIAFKRTKELQQSTQQLLEAMADTVDLRDPYTGGHSRRVTEFCTNILRELSIAGEECDLILSAARVHDIGKIAIPDEILKKPGKLTAEEWVIMQSHVERGAELLRRYPDFARGVEIVRHHHERWDGTGYPARLKGFDIPLGARVLTVADSFDAMTTDRPYRKSLSSAHAATVLRRERGRQFDPQIVDAFLSSIAHHVEQPISEPASTGAAAPVAV